MSVKSFAEAVKEGITKYTRAFGIEQAEAEEEEFATKAEAALAVPLTQKGAANGVATLGAGSTIPEAQLPSVVKALRVWPPVTVAASISTGGKNTHGIAINPAGTKAYVCCWESSELIPVTVATGVPGTGLSIEKARSVAITPDGTKALVTSDIIIGTAGKVTVVNLSSFTIEKTISVTANQVNGIAITPNGEYALVCTQEGVFPIEISTGSVKAALAAGSKFRDVVVLPNGTAAYATNYLGGSVLPITISGSTFTAGSPITVAAGPQGIDASNEYVYVTGYGSHENVPAAGAVILIKVSSNTVQPPIPFPGNPSYVALSPSHETLWVGSYSRESMIPLNLATLALGPETFCSKPTLRPVITPDGTKLFVTTGLSGTGANLTEFAIGSATSVQTATAQPDVIGSDGKFGGAGTVPSGRQVISQPGTAEVGSTEQVILTMRLPANSTYAGTALRVDCRGAGTATAEGAAKARIRVGTTGTTADAEVCSAAAGKFTSGGFVVDGALEFQREELLEEHKAIGNIRVNATSLIEANLVSLSKVTAGTVVNPAEVLYVSLTIQGEGTEPALKVTNALLSLVTI